jgi:opacity protein-like surface antigen
MMKSLLVGALLLGSVGVTRAQEAAAALCFGKGSVAQELPASSATKATFLGNLGAADTLVKLLAKPTIAFAAPASPPPQPKLLYGGREDYRWQLSIAASWLRFQSSLFNASAVGINTSVVYFTNGWFGIEGNVAAVFASPIPANEHVKIATYGAGPKIAWRQKQWEPWLHGIFGGAHEQPQFAGQSRNSYTIKAGGGTDYRWNPRVSLRLEGDYVRTDFFQQSQNDLQLAGGVVFHF